MYQIVHYIGDLTSPIIRLPKVRVSAHNIIITQIIIQKGAKWGNKLHNYMMGEISHLLQFKI